MAGHRTRLADGRYKVVFETGVDPATGKRRRHTKLFDSYRESGKFLHRLEEDGLRGITAHPSRLTVAEYMRSWYELRVRRRVRAKTAERYLAIIEQHVIPTMGALRLSEVTASDVQAAVAAWMDAGLSATTVGHHYDIVRGAFGWAVDSGQLARNPALAATPPPRARREMVAWEPDHCRVALEALGNSTIYLPVLMGLATGMRRGEVCALDWREVDLSKGRLRVVRTLTQTSDGLEFCDPKTAAGRREIPMPPALTSELRAIRKMQAQNKLAMRGTYADNGLVYCDPDGSPHKPDSLSGTFSNWIRRHHDRLELPVIGFHGLRHTYASLLLAAGVDLKTIAKLMGHTNVGFTLHTYAHVMRGSEEAAAEAVSAAIAGSGH